MKKIIYVAIIFASIFGLVSCDPAFNGCLHRHIEIVDAVAPTCHTEGVVAHAHCPDCGLNFALDEGKPQINRFKPVVLDSVAIPVDSTAHGQMSFVGGKAATCCEEGRLAYYECDLCGKKYADEEGTQLLEDVALPVNPDNHLGNYVSNVPYKAATCDAEGQKACQYCSKCGSYFVYDYQTKTNKTIDHIIPRHIVDDKGVCIMCGDTIITTFDNLFKACEEGIQNIGLGCDIACQGDLNLCGDLNLHGCTLDFGGVTITGNGSISNGVILGPFRLKVAKLTLTDVDIWGLECDTITALDSDLLLGDVHIATKGKYGIKATNSAITFFGEVAIESVLYGVGLTDGSLTLAPNSVSAIATADMKSLLVLNSNAQFIADKTARWNW